MNKFYWIRITKYLNCAFFSADYRFTTCGATGRFGPNQTMCDIAYNNTKMSVSVVAAAPYQGLQVWEVPEEGLYS